MPDPLLQRVAVIVDDAIGALGAALGGGNALWAHGVVDRPTADLDTFLDSQSVIVYDQAEHALIAAFGREGLDATVLQSDSWFRGFLVTDRSTGQAVRVDINYSDREYPPVQIKGVGAVLDLHDVLLGKLKALTTRAAERDFFDIDALLSSRRWTIHELSAMLRSASPTWTPARFADVLASARAGDEFEYHALGMGPQQVEDMFSRLDAHAEILRNADV